MQDAGPQTRHLRLALVALAVTGMLGAVVAGLLVTWQAGVVCYALAVTGCVVALLQAAGRAEGRAVPAPVLAGSASRHH